MTFETRLFGQLFAEPTRNGLMRPKAIRGSGTKMVNMGELFAYPRIRNVSMDRVPLGDVEVERYVLEEGDLLFARQSLVLEGAGKCSIFLGDDEPVTFESHVTRVRLNKQEASPEYFFYYFQSAKGRAAIKSIVEQGAGAAGIRGGDLQGLPVEWRDVREQKEIAHILGTLDDKVELNRRMNETLEVIARAIFKSWFVDFDPVRAKASGEPPESICSRLGLTPELLALFPDRLQDSELGEIPDGWEVGTLGVYAELNPESWTKDNPPVAIEYVDLANTKCGKIEATQSFPWKKAPSRAQRVLRAGDTIVGTVRPGNCSFAFIGDDGLTGSTGFAVLRPKKATYEAYVYLSVSRKENIDRLAHLADGAAYPAVSPDVVLGTECVVFCDELIDQFGALSKPLLTRTAANEHESRTLSVIRDTLLPNLISGQLRVPEAVTNARS